MRAREISPDVVAMMPADVETVDHSATNGGFVIGTRAVLMVESLSTGRLAAEMIAALRSRTSLPIRYLVNTSHHGDHCFGNFVLPPETVVMAHPSVRRKLTDEFETERAHMISFMGPGCGLEEVVARPPDLGVADTLTVDLGGIDVEIRYIGFIQTQGDLAISVPARNVVFVGNALQAPPPAFAWVPDGRVAETIASHRRLYDWLDDDTVIVPGHGELMCRSDIVYSIDYLETLTATVADCVAEGLDLAETVEKAALPQYSNYSMYDIAHRRVNVPAVFAELAATRAGLPPP